MSLLSRVRLKPLRQKGTRIPLVRSAIISHIFRLTSRFHLSVGGLQKPAFLTQDFGTAISCQILEGNGHVVNQTVMHSNVADDESVGLINRVEFDRWIFTV